MPNDMNQNLPDSTNWITCRNYNGGECVRCFGVGANDVMACAELYGNDVAFRNNEIATCSDGYYAAAKNSKHHEPNNKGCTKEDECCVHVASNRSRLPFGRDIYFRCNNPCRLHINKIAMASKTIYDWNSWSNQTDIIRGHFVGGKVCYINVMFGYCLLIPIFLNWLFVLKVWHSDFNHKTTIRSTFVFGVTATYPMALVVRYLSNWRNQDEMKQQKARFEREVATAEGYLESILQVCDYVKTILFTGLL